MPRGPGRVSRWNQPVETPSNGGYFGGARAPFVKSILGATALLGGSSVVSILVGLVSVKVWAVLLGPSGLGLLGLLQSFLDLAVLVAGMGIGAGLVRSGANALARQGVAWGAAQRRGAR